MTLSSLVSLSPLYITNEPNDKDLVKALPDSIAYELKCGDINHQGYWVAGEQIWIWGERKKLSDLVTCALDSGRLLRQVQEAHQAGFKFLYLIVEATYRESPVTGLLEVRKPIRGAKGQGTWTAYHINPRDSKSATVPYSRIRGYLNQLRYYLGVHVYHTASVKETAATVMGIYGMFQVPPESHNTLKQFATTPEPVASFLHKPSLIRRMAKELPGIGWDKSHDIELELKTAKELCRVLAEGDREKLLGIPGIGKKTVDNIQTAIAKSED